VWNIAGGIKFFWRDARWSLLPRWVLLLPSTKLLARKPHAWDSVYLGPLVVSGGRGAVLSFASHSDSQRCLTILLPAAVILAIALLFPDSFLYLALRATWGTAAYTLISSRSDALLRGCYLCGGSSGPHLEIAALTEIAAYHVSLALLGLGGRDPHYKRWSMERRAMCIWDFLSRLVL